MDTIQADTPVKKTKPLPLLSRPATITIKRAQQESGLSRVTINRRIWSGELKTTHVGSRHLIYFDSFQKMLGIDQTEASTE